VATDSHWHVLDLHAIGAAGGTAFVDGSATAAAYTTTPNFPSYYCIGGHSGAQSLTGDVAEAVMTYNVTFGATPSYAAGILANQTAFYGAFPQ
jgi:hypothetical protein